MEGKKLNTEENALPPKETEQAVMTAGEALKEMMTADGVIGEGMLEEEMTPNDELTDEEAAFATGAIQLATPSPLYPITSPIYPIKRKESSTETSAN